MIRIVPKKISHRLTATYAMLFFASVLLMNAVALVCVQYYLYQSASQQITLVDDALRSKVHTLKDIPGIDLKNISQVTENIDVTLTYHNRTIYNTGERYPLPAANAKSLRMIHKTESGERGIMYLDDRVILTDGEELFIQIVKDTSSEEAYTHALAGILVITDIIILIVSVFAGYIVSKKALNPIDQISQQAQRISVEKLDMRLVLDGPDDELKRLADTFNDFLSRIQNAYEKQNQFALDASHELATPLAVIKGYVDLLDRWGKHDASVLDEGLSSIKSELANMTGLLDTLLFISRSDNAIIRVEKTPFEMSELLSEVIRETELLDGQHPLVLDSATKVLMNGDRRLIKQMMRALIDNSRKYSPVDSSITIRCALEGESVVLSVEDQGIGIPPEELSHIFDRFYRVDRARSRATGGSGLGLSIVKWIVENHQGTVTAQSTLGQGTIVVVALPKGV